MVYWLGPGWPNLVYKRAKTIEAAIERAATPASLGFRCRLSVQMHCGELFWGEIGVIAFFIAEIAGFSIPAARENHFFLFEVIIFKGSITHMRPSTGHKP